MNPETPTRLPFDLVERLFPFSFFEEVHALLDARIAAATPDTQMDEPEFRLANPIWLFSKSPRSRAEAFANQRNIIRQKGEDFPFLHQIVAIEPFGDLLILELCIRADAEKDFTDPLKRSQLPLAFLAAQYYDANGAAILTPDRLTDIPADLTPEQLGLFVVEMNATAPLVSVLTAPNDMYDRWGERVDATTGGETDADTK